MNKKLFLIFSIIIAVIGIIIILNLFDFTRHFIEEKSGLKINFGKIFHDKLPDNSVEIIISKDNYKVGEEIFFGIQNKTGLALKIENNCPYNPMEVYRMENNRWKKLHLKADIVCKNDGDIIIEPYELKVTSYMPWGNLIFNVLGKYRLEVEIEGYGNDFYKEFAIIE